MALMLTPERAMNKCPAYQAFSTSAAWNSATTVKLSVLCIDKFCLLCENTDPHDINMVKQHVVITFNMTLKQYRCCNTCTI